MGGFVLASSQKTLTPQGILKLADLGEVAVVKTTKASIMDRSKADGIGKLLICFQAAWMVIQCIGRLANHLPLTLLEINTLGHVLCALSLYTIWYHKPQDMNDPFSLQTVVSDLDPDSDSDSDSRSTRTTSWRRPRIRPAYSAALEIQDGDDPIRPGTPAPNANLSPDPASSRTGPFSSAEEVANWNVKEFSKSFTIQRHLVFCLASSIFGSLHLMAWHSTFPSLIEKLLWRSSAVYVTGSGIMVACCLLAVHVSSKPSAIFTSIVTIGMLTSAPALYVGARLFLLLEAFISLRALPMQAYQTPEWTLSIPHL